MLHRLFEDKSEYRKLLKNLWSEEDELGRIRSHLEYEKLNFNVRIFWLKSAEINIVIQVRRATIAAITISSAHIWWID